MPSVQNRFNPSSIRHFRKRLLAWYDRKKRDLPWRRSPSLYKTVVSEFMLQQTQVETVRPYFERWMRRFPDFATLARARSSTVLKAWEGLGYYSRARNLHALAKRIHAEGPPTDAIAWQALPGIGPYTAAAITSIAFNEPSVTVDGNVVRVLSRIMADATAFKGGAEAARHFRPIAKKLLDRPRPGDFNQAMMELGATFCLPKNPRCGKCPVAGHCAALAEGNPQRYPNLLRRKTQHVRISRLWALRGGRLLLQRAASGSKRLAELYELPSMRQRTETPGLRLLAVKKRSISNQRIEERIFELNRASEVPAKRLENSSVEWVPVQHLGGITLSGPHRRWVNELLSR